MPLISPLMPANQYKDIWRRDILSATACCETLFKCRCEYKRQRGAHLRSQNTRYPNKNTRWIFFSGDDVGDVREKFGFKTFRCCRKILTKNSSGGVVFPGLSLMNAASHSLTACITAEFHVRSLTVSR